MQVARHLTGEAGWGQSPQTPNTLLRMITMQKKIRQRPYQINFHVNDKEKNLIEKKQKESGIINKGVFYRKMIIDGYVVKTDNKAIKELTVAINRIGNNINQITRKVNQTGKIFQTDMSAINEKVGEIWLLLKSMLLSQR